MLGDRQPGPHFLELQGVKTKETESAVRTEVEEGQEKDKNIKCKRSVRTKTVNKLEKMCHEKKMNLRQIGQKMKPM